MRKCKAVKLALRICSFFFQLNSLYNTEQSDGARRLQAYLLSNLMAITNEPFKPDVLELCTKLDHEYACTSSMDILEKDI